MNQQKINRRRFLVLTGAVLGSCALCCAGASIVSTSEDNQNTVLTMGVPERTFGEGKMTKKILVAYATASGSTGGVAETIGQSLAKNDAKVDVRPVGSVASLDGYDAVVLGSAVHGGKWLPEAVSFLEANQAQLNQMPTAFFLVGLTVNRKDQSTQKMVGQFLAAERALVKPVAEGRFVGAMYTKDSPGLQSLGIRFFIAYCGLGLRGGDFRDPAAIQAWATEIKPLLLS